jgi:hypothetical protein
MARVVALDAASLPPESENEITLREARARQDSEKAKEFYDKWARLPYWSLGEAVLLVLDHAPVQVVPDWLREKAAELGDLIIRGLKAGVLSGGDELAPRSLLDYLESRHVAIPEGLSDSVACFHGAQGGASPLAVSAPANSLAVICAERDALAAEVGRLRALSGSEAGSGAMLSIQHDIVMKVIGKRVMHGVFL